MGKTFKDRAKWERKNNDRAWRERRAELPRFNDRAWREQSQQPRRENAQTANTASV